MARACALWAQLLVSACVMHIAFGASCGTVRDLTGQYRKDHYLPYWQYPEYNQPNPVDGGRVHLVGSTAGLTGKVVSVQVNGEEALNLPAPSSPDFTYFDWARFYTNATTSRFWLSFHSRNTAWLDTPGATLAVALKDEAGNCVQGVYTPRVRPTFVTWATPATSPTDWVVHVHHNVSATGPATLSAVTFDGANVTTHPTLPLVLQPGDHAVLHVESRVPKPRGSLYTVSVFGEASPAASVSSSAGLAGFTEVGATSFAIGNGGRTPEARFPLVTYPQSQDCPLPGMNAQTWADIASHDIDTVMMFTGDAKHKCGHPIVPLLNTLGENGTSGAHAFIDTTAADATGPALSPAGKRLVSAVYITGEDDGKLDQSMRLTAGAAQAISTAHPSLLTFQGGKTNRHDGAYAGCADIQGLDIYVGACAPSITEAIFPLPLLASFAYYRSTRDNQMPLPSMTYSQLYSGAWSYQANGNEIAFQIAAVAAAGAKGILFFQTSFQLGQQSRGWDGVIKRTLATFTQPTVREVLRRGDAQGMPVTNSDGGDIFYKAPSVATVIRSDNYVLLIVLNSGATGYNSLTCHIGLGTHWQFPAHTVSAITMRVTADMDISAGDVAQAKEVVGGLLVPPAAGASFALTGGSVVASNIAFAANNVPVRVFLLPYALKA